MKALAAVTCGKRQSDHAIPHPQIMHTCEPMCSEVQQRAWSYAIMGV